jgi:putative flippase GtrA
MLFTFVKQITESLRHPADNNTLKAQVIRQMASGAIATLTDIISFKLGLLIGLHILLSSLLGLSMGAVVNFIITRHYVYGQIERQKKKASTQFLLYIPTVLVTICITQLIMLILCVKLGFDPMLVKVFVAVPLVFLWTLLSGKYLIFNKRPKSNTED